MLRDRLRHLLTAEGPLPERLKDVGADLMKEPQVAQLVLALASVSGKASEFTAAQKERVAATLGLVREDEHRKVQRKIARLEADLTRLKHRLAAAEKRLPDTDPGIHHDRPS